ncbi:hypothetical protein [Colwellia sp. UCD-KL20]|uniref:hypothetical protein n=1 Tax=Colwellia sp. UCD-KL20 TaxID=1917165 RepID=UPI000970D0C4|nr:hypothetical protein [Colwellia sp. UCD-KL20]
MSRLHLENSSTLRLIKDLLPEIFGVIFGITSLAFGFIVFSLSFKLVDSIGTIENMRNMDTLSISAIVAIALFLIKETLELFRKSQARKRKIRALKVILAEEMKINYWTWLKVKDLVETVMEMPSGTHYQITTSTSGTERFKWMRPDGGGGGQSFPCVQDDILTKLIIEIAELDESFYNSAIAYSKGLAELKHLREGAYDFIHETQQGEHYAEGFCDYASDELPKIESSFINLFKKCTGKSELQHRMR